MHSGAAIADASRHTGAAVAHLVAHLVAAHPVVHRRAAFSGYTLIAWTRRAAVVARVAGAAGGSSAGASHRHVRILIQHLIHSLTILTH